MRTFKEIKFHYHFTTEDEKRLLSLKDLMTENVGKIMDALHSWLLQTKETARFFTEENKTDRVFNLHKSWFLELFSGNYDSRYYDRIIKIGQKHVKVKGNLEQGIISALGSLLMLWVMVELINTEITFLKGGKVRISIFIGVALVAFLRETLIMTLRHEKGETIYYLIALVLITGIVYWLVTRAEERVK